MKAKIESSSSFEERVREIVLYRVRPHLLEQVVEKGLRRELGDKLGRVYLINETDEGLLAFARKLLNRKR